MNNLKKSKISDAAETQLAVMLTQRLATWISDREYLSELLPALRELSRLTPFLENYFEEVYLEYYYGLR